MKREFLQNLTVGDQSLPKEVIDAIMEEHGKSVQKGKQWQEKYEQALVEHASQLQQLKFDHQLHDAIAKAKGRNAKAITALLDVAALRADPEGLDGAIAQLKEENGYLFEEEVSAPPYAKNTGAQVAQQGRMPATLAGALRERFERRK